MRNSLAVLALCLSAAPALAHVSLAEPNAAPSSRYVAHFRVGHGCDGKPTTALTVALPPSVTQVVAARGVRNVGGARRHSHRGPVHAASPARPAAFRLTLP